MTILKISTVIVALIIFIILITKNQFKKLNITTQDGLEDCVKDEDNNSKENNSEQKIPERYINEHVRSVIFNEKKYNVHEGSRLHQLALKNKRKVTR